MSLTVLHPAPEPARYHLSRAGLIGLFEYEEETFEFERGKLLLRGPNGSGKSKALELILPLLLDGELRPERLDPFGGQGRSMRWNLLGEEDSGSATGAGYSWLELSRTDETGRRHWVTLVLGVSANRNERDVRSWFALIEASQAPGEELRGHRIGVNAALTRERAPISRSALAELCGEVIDSAATYRAEVNEALFGLPEERYEAIVRLLLSLRKPQLSKTLDPRELSARLTEALPELDRDSVMRVSTRLDQLDRIRREASELVEVLGAVRGFTGTYRDWARAALRERGATLKGAADRREGSEQAVAEARGEAEAAATHRSELAEQQGRLDTELAAARAACEELRASEGWQQAERLDELRRLAEAAETELAARERALERGRSDREEAEAALEDASAAHEGQRRDLEGALGEADRLAEQAGIAEHAAIVEGLGAEGDEAEQRDPAAVGALLVERSEARERQLDRLEELRRELHRAEGELVRARERFEAAEATQRERQAERAAAVERLADERAALLEAFEAWRSGLSVLALDDELSERVETALAAAGEHDAPDGRRLAGEHGSRIEQGLREERARSLAERAGIAAEREPLVAERESLEAEQDPVPRMLHFRSAEREGREGAPLWSLVDFDEDLSPVDRAGIEGALEGAGLLDAWITPEGEALDVDDATLVAVGGRAGKSGRTLADALTPVPEGPVSAGVVTSILGLIGLSSANPTGAGSEAEVPGADDGEATDEPDFAADAWVTTGGRFGLGPLSGRRQLERARFIGARARAANRARRLEEVNAEVARLDALLTGLDDGIESLDSRLGSLAEELEAFPDSTLAVRAHAFLQGAQREERAAAERTAGEQRSMEDRASARELARSEAQLHSGEQRLPGPDDGAAIDALAKALGRYRERVGELVHAATLLDERDRAAADARRRTDRAGEDLATAEARHADAQRSAGERRAAHEQARAAVGESVEQLRARLAERTEAAERAEAELRSLRDEREQAAARAARAEAEVDVRERALAEAAAELARALEGLARLSELGAWELALAEDAPDDHAEASGWPVERALEALASVPRERLATRRGLETLIEDVDRGADELRHRLAASEFEVLRRRVPEDPALTRVEVRHGGQSRPIAALEGWLDGELAAREQTIADGDRKLFESFLVGGLADELRERITEAGRLVATMNQTLAGCETSSGMSIELEWQPHEHEHAALREVTKLLRRDVALLHDADRARLVEFLRRRIEEARESLEHGSTSEHVMAALDYRAWHEFRVIQIKDGHRERLTKRRHQRGSGGEKAVALHLPLFAAAAAQFSAAESHAPRLILLDEALAGIDEKMRAQLLGLLERFDLDFVLTSHELWGCYPEVSALGIYHLHREPGLPGVASAHFRWDGERRVEVERAA